MGLMNKTSIYTNSHSDLCKTLLMSGIYTAAFEKKTNTVFIVIDDNGKNCFLDGKRLEKDKYKASYVLGYHKNQQNKVEDLLNKVTDTIYKNKDICEHCIHRFGYYLTGECKELYEDERTINFNEVKKI